MSSLRQRRRHNPLDGGDDDGVARRRPLPWRRGGGGGDNHPQHRHPGADDARRAPPPPPPLVPPFVWAVAHRENDDHPPLLPPAAARGDRRGRDHPYLEGAAEGGGAAFVALLGAVGGDRRPDGAAAAPARREGDPPGRAAAAVDREPDGDRRNDRRPRLPPAVAARDDHRRRDPFGDNDDGGAVAMLAALAPPHRRDGDRRPARRRRSSSSSASSSTAAASRRRAAKKRRTRADSPFAHLLPDPLADNYCEMEPPEPSQATCLDWRMDAAVSLSDWTIQIRVLAAAGEEEEEEETAEGGTTADQAVGDRKPKAGDADKTSNEEDERKPEAKEGSGTKTAPAAAEAQGNSNSSNKTTTTTTTQLYHVHRNILSVGAKGSVYFRQLFQTTSHFAETQTQTSTIALHPLAAQAFPVLLDYLYSWDDRVAVTPANSAALHHLAQYLQVDRLAWKVRRYWRSSSAMNVRDCAVGYRHARIFRDGALREAVVEKCARDIWQIQPDWTDFMEASDADLWRGILRHRHHGRDRGRRTRCESRHLSLLLDEFLKNATNGGDGGGGGGALNAETFGQLTDADHLPHIDPEAAVTFLTVEQKLGLTSNNNSGSDDNNNAEELTALQERCVETLASLDWQRLEQHETALAKLGSRLVSRLLVQVAKKASGGGGGGGHDRERARMPERRSAYDDLPPRRFEYEAMFDRARARRHNEHFERDPNYMV